MNCQICLEDNKLPTEMEILPCCHKLCNNCMDRLQKNLCPFCRTVIREEINIEIPSFINIDDSFIIDIIPVSFKYKYNRKMKKKKKKSKKKSKNFVSNKIRVLYNGRRKKKFKKEKIREYLVY